MLLVGVCINLIMWLLLLIMQPIHTPISVFDAYEVERVNHLFYHINVMRGMNNGLDSQMSTNIGQFNV